MAKTVLKGGKIVDPANEVYKVSDVVIDGGKIEKIVDHYNPAMEDHVISAGGCIVAPGLIDHHAHLYPFAKIGIPAEAVCFASGVTAVVEAGSAGPGNYREYRPFLKSVRLKICPYIHVSPLGLATLPEALENVAPAALDEGALREVFSEFKGELAGLKIRISAPIVREFGFEPLKRTIRIAENLGLSVMVHCTEPPGTMDELVGFLRPGDVLTHMYMNIGSTILDDGGGIRASVRNARKRGVLFEAADARAHFGFPVAETAVEKGFWPDFIATDLTVLGMHVRPTTFNMAMQLARYTNLGIPFREVLRRCTINPAKQLGLPGGAGTLSPGASADVAVFRIVETDVTFGDRIYGTCGQNLRHGKFVCEPVLTIKDGLLVYRNITF